MDSILISIKKLLGLEEDYEPFDDELIAHINSFLMVLTQLGVGPEEGFSISDDGQTWKDFAGDYPNLEAIRTFTYLNVKLVFDPPTNSAVIESMKNIISGLEWRININAEQNN